MGKLVRRLTFAGTIFIGANWSAGYLVDFIVWFFDANKTENYFQNKKTFDFFFDILIPYIISALVTIKYIARVFYIPTPRDVIKFAIAFIAATWGWVILKFLWDLFFR